MSLWLPFKHLIEVGLATFILLQLKPVLDHINVSNGIHATIADYLGCSGDRDFIHGRGALRFITVTLIRLIGRVGAHRPCLLHPELATD